MKAGSGQLRRLRVVLGYLIAIAAVYFTVQRLDLSPAALWPSTNALWRWEVPGALALFTLHGFMNAAAFGYLLRAFGAASSVGAGAAAWGASVLAKYIPGGIWHVVGRGVILQRQGVTARAMLATAVLEQLISLGACLAVVLLAAGVTMKGPGALFWYAGPAILLVLLALPLWLPKSLGLVGGRTYLAAAAAYISALAPYAAAYLLLVSPLQVAAFVQALFEGTVAGVLALFAPGGLGVRESWVVFNQVELGGAQMLGMLLFARVLIILSEALVTLSAIYLAARSGPATDAEPGMKP